MSAPASFRSLAALAAALFPLLFMGCDPFATRDFSPKPAEIRPFASDFTRQDTLRFRVTETLSDPDDAAKDVVLARRILRFAKAPDAQQGTDGWVTLSVSVDSDPAGTYSDRGFLKVRFDSQGLALKAPDSSSAGSGSARYFPLKQAASSASGNAADTSEFLSLPTAFQPGAEWVAALGILEVSRSIEETDTLDYGGHLEESWRVAEVVRGGGRTLGRGTFWYGASGLLKGEQTWDFEGRSADGSPSATRELRRELVRL